MVKATSISLVLLLAGCAASEVSKSPVVPVSLSVPSDQVLATEAIATGVQIYTCSTTDSGKFEWVFKGPEADLYDRNGRRIGKHYAGPTWEGVDGSKVVGEVKQRDNAPDQNAIPWLLLSAKNHAGQGVFAGVQSIQRVNTAAGKAPSQNCDQEQLGKVARMDYRATYYFYQTR
jgi:hypothetical protein